MRVKKYNQLPIRKRFGQNFLRDPNIINQIIEKSGFTKDDLVMEIGPGHGVLTEKLVPLVSQLYAVEIDRDLFAKLQTTFSHTDNLQIINADFLKFNFDELSLDDYKLENRKVIGNIPYYITTPIIMKIIDEKRIKVFGINPDYQYFSEIVIMMQKEVGDRLLAEPGSKDYGALSVIGQYACEIEQLLFVDKRAFYPVPKVDSVVLRLKLKQNDDFLVEKPEILWRLVKAVFTSRRKTLRNSLKISKFSSEQIAHLGRYQDLDIRGETLSLSEFCRVSNLLNI